MSTAILSSSTILKNDLRAKPKDFRLGRSHKTFQWERPVQEAFQTLVNPLIQDRRLRKGEHFEMRVTEDGVFIITDDGEISLLEEYGNRMDDPLTQSKNKIIRLAESYLHTDRSKHSRHSKKPKEFARSCSPKGSSTTASEVEDERSFPQLPSQKPKGSSSKQDISLLRQQLEQAKHDIRGAQNEANELNGQLNKVKHERNSLQEEIRKLKERNSSLQGEVHHRKQETDSLKEELALTHAQLVQAHESQQYQQRIIQYKSTLISGLEHERVRLLDEIGKLRQTDYTQGVKIQSLTRNLNQVKNTLKEANKQLDQAQEIIQEEAAYIAELENRYFALEGASNNMLSQLNKILVEKQANQEKIKDLTTQLNNKGQELELLGFLLKGTLQFLAQAQAEKDVQIKALQKEKANLVERVNALNFSKAAVSRERDMLSSQIVVKNNELREAREKLEKANRRIRDMMPQLYGAEERTKQQALEIQQLQNSYKALQEERDALKANLEKAARCEENYIKELQKDNVIMQEFYNKNKKLQKKLTSQAKKHKAQLKKQAEAHEERGQQWHQMKDEIEKLNLRNNGHQHEIAYAKEKEHRDRERLGVPEGQSIADFAQEASLERADLITRNDALQRQVKSALKAQQLAETRFEQQSSEMAAHKEALLALKRLEEEAEGSKRSVLALEAQLQGKKLISPEQLFAKEEELRKLREENRQLQLIKSKGLPESTNNEELQKRIKELEAQIDLLLTTKALKELHDQLTKARAKIKEQEEEIRFLKQSTGSLKPKSSSLTSKVTVLPSTPSTGSSRIRELEQENEQQRYIIEQQKERIEGYEGMIESELFSSQKNSLADELALQQTKTDADLEEAYGEIHRLQLETGSEPSSPSDTFFPISPRTVRKTSSITSPFLREPLTPPSSPLTTRSSSSFALSSISAKPNVTTPIREETTPSSLTLTSSSPISLEAPLSPIPIQKKQLTISPSPISTSSPSDPTATFSAPSLPPTLPLMSPSSTAQIIQDPKEMPKIQPEVSSELFSFLSTSSPAGHSPTTPAVISSNSKTSKTLLSPAPAKTEQPQKVLTRTEKAEERIRRRSTLASSSIQPRSIPSSKEPSSASTSPISTPAITPSSLSAPLILQSPTETPVQFSPPPPPPSSKIKRRKGKKTPQAILTILSGLDSAISGNKTVIVKGKKARLAEALKNHPNDPKAQEAMAKIDQYLGIKS